MRITAYNLYEGAAMAGNLPAPRNPYEKGRKRSILPAAENGRAGKRIKPLLEEDTSDEHSTSSASGGVPLERPISPINENSFTINQDFARRFEYNKKREELQKRTCHPRKIYPCMS